MFVSKALIKGSNRQVYLLKSIISIAFLVGILLSLKLWTADRTYPLTPLFPIFSEITPSANNILLIIFIILLIGICVLKKVRILIIAAVIVYLIMILQDQMRLQPWAYQYMFMLFVLAFFPWQKSENKKHSNSVLNTLRFLLALIYIWSGLHKANEMFINEVFIWMNQPLSILAPLINPFGFFIPIIEAGLGLSLLIPKIRKYAVLGLTGMHIYILFVLSPVGLNWNSVIWPWNLTMISFLYILFWNSNVPIKKIVLQKNLKQVWVIIFFAILPLSSFFGIWDSYISFALYSEDTKKAAFEISANSFDQMPKAVQKNSEPLNYGWYLYDHFMHSIDELNVPTYPEIRVYKSIMANLCQYAKDPSDIRLTIYKKVKWFDFGWEDIQLNCNTK